VKALGPYVLLETLVVAQLTHEFPPFMEEEGPFLCLQDNGTESYPDPDEFSPHKPLYFNIILPATPSVVMSSFQVSDLNFVCVSSVSCIQNPSPV
jgi:hypothetical protein